MVDLQPFNFVLHQAVESEGVFVGREWVFAEILESFRKIDSEKQGVVSIETFVSTVHIAEW